MPPAGGRLHLRLDLQQQEQVRAAPLKVGVLRVCGLSGRRQVKTRSDTFSFIPPTTSSLSCAAGWFAPRMRSAELDFKQQMKWRQMLLLCEGQQGPDEKRR